MTTVAWDGKTIAADRQLGDDMRGSAPKLWRMKDGSVIGGAGFYDEIVEIVAWLTAGAKEDKKPALPESDDDSSDILVISKDGQAYWLTWPYLRRVPIIESFCAVGSGAKYAIGAMAMGANARRAVQVASRFDPQTGRGINSVRVTD